MRQARSARVVGSALAVCIAALSGVLLLRPGVLLPSAGARPTQTSSPTDPFPVTPVLAAAHLLRQTAAEAARQSDGCLACHRNTADPHAKTTLNLGCADCHGGNPCAATKELAHEQPRFPDEWPSSANPVRSYALLNHERPEFVRFVNPGDLRVAHLSCGTAGCHPKEVLQVHKSMMSHGCMPRGARHHTS